MKQPVVSIIIPIYNAEAALRRCIDSVLSQEYRDFELILADDGSTDSSGAICDEYAAAHPNVRVLHKKNSGVSDTRNQAIALAQGEYLQFIDSDDWITPECTKLFVRTAKEHDCDLVIADFYRVSGKTISQKGDISEQRVLTREEFASHMMGSPADFYYGVLWNKLFRRSLIEKHGLHMNPELHWCEDFIFNLEYILHAERFYSLTVPIYYYVKTKGSLVAKQMNPISIIRMKRMVFEYYNKFYKEVFDAQEYDRNIPQIYQFLIDAASDNFVLPHFLPGSKRLGEERDDINEQALLGEGVLLSAYRDEKLLDHYLKIAAIKNSLSESEMRVLFLLIYHRRLQAASVHEFAELLRLSQNGLALALQKLTIKGYIRVCGVDADEVGNDPEACARQINLPLLTSQNKPLNIEALPAFDRLLPDLINVQNDYENARFAGFTEDEYNLYAQLSNKIKQNIGSILLPSNEKRK